MAHHCIDRCWHRLAACLLAAVVTVLLSSPAISMAEAAQPRVAIVGFTSRVHKTDLTLTDLKEPLPELLSVARDQLTAELAGEQKFSLYDFGEQTTTARCEEAAFVDALGLSGRDQTVYAELSLRVMDAHTGAIVFVTKADSRRKAELSYNAIWQRHDSGEEDAIAAALGDAATNLAAQFKQAM